MLLKRDKMSDNSESGSDDAKYDNEADTNGNASDICRDYLRNVCKRGQRCKYRHPNSAEAKDVNPGQDYTFCHDFQNTGCRRPSCKFLHCSREEEEYCKQTGQLPVRLQQAAALGIGVTQPEIPVMKGGVPVCKDNLKGECRRGNKCKFRHVTVSEYEYQMGKTEPRGTFRENFDRFDRFEYDHEPSTKRRRMDREFDNFSTFDNRFQNSKPLSYQLLEDENTMLRRKVDELKKQVADLTATNEVLLEQNARYRVSKSNILHTINAGVQNSVQATSLNHLNTTLAQQIALNSDLVSQQALQQRMVRELTAPQVQCSLAPPTMNSGSMSMNQPNIVPVSLSQTVPGLQPPVSLPNPNQSIQQNMAAAAAAAAAGNAPSASLVSYPIVSQGLRMTASSLAH